MILHLLLAVYVVAAFADASGTAYCHGRGTCRERNPLLRPLVARFGVVVAMTVKGAMHAGILWWLLAVAPAAAVRVIVPVLAVAQVYVVIYNARTGALR